MILSNDVILGYLDCKYKAYLMICGETGIRSDYQRLMLELDKDFQALATAKTLHESTESLIQCGVNVTPSELENGLPLILHANLEKSPFHLHFDALKKVHGRSSFGEFHYIPVFFHNERTVREKHKIFLAIAGLMLGELQECQPKIGVIIYGQICRSVTIKLDKYQLMGRRIIEDLLAIAKLTFQPPFTLCRHCRLCQFHERCRTEAKEMDDLSLLRGIGQKEIQRNHSKGIFTVNQLSYTFRPRRRGPRVKKQRHPYYYSLQALAIREKRVYIFNKPKMPNANAKVFIDLEGDSNARFVYLAGALIVEKGIEKTYSLWANSPDEEKDIFEELVRILRSLTRPYLFYYGSYESRFFRRMLSCTPIQDIEDLWLHRSMNIITAIYSNIYFPTYSNDLKEIGGFLGCNWSVPNSSGLQSIVWRREWERSHDPTLKQTLIQYNQEDCAALKKVTDFLYRIPADDLSGSEKTFTQEIASVSDITNYEGERRSHMARRHSP